MSGFLQKPIGLLGLVLYESTQTSVTFAENKRFVKLLIPKVKPWDSWTELSKDDKQYFTVVLFVFQFFPVGNFAKLINFGVGTVRSERVKQCSINGHKEGRGRGNIDLINYNAKEF